VINDISYVLRNELESSVLFEPIYHRYKRRSLLVTSSQLFQKYH
jgi:DNA replication protein DnaC